NPRRDEADEVGARTSRVGRGRKQEHERQRHAQTGPPSRQRADAKETQEPENHERCDEDDERCHAPNIGQSRLAGMNSLAACSWRTLTSLLSGRRPYGDATLLDPRWTGAHTWFDRTTVFGDILIVDRRAARSIDDGLPVQGERAFQAPRSTFHATATTSHSRQAGQFEKDPQSGRTLA